MEHTAEHVMISRNYVCRKLRFRRMRSKFENLSGTKYIGDQLTRNRTAPRHLIPRKMVPQQLIPTILIDFSD